MQVHRLFDTAAPDFRHWLITFRQSAAARLFVSFIFLFVIITTPSVHAANMTSGLELSPAKLKLDRPVHPGDKIELKTIKVTNTGNSAADITITPKGAAKTDTTKMRLEPGVSSSFVAWLEIPEDIAEGAHQDSIDVRAQGADKQNSVMLQVLVGYEIKEAGFVTVIVNVASDNGMYLIVILFLIVAYYWLKAKRKSRTAYVPQPAYSPMAGRLQNVVHGQYAPAAHTNYSNWQTGGYYPEPYSAYPAPVYANPAYPGGQSQATGDGLSLAERLAATRHQAGEAGPAHGPDSGEGGEHP